MFLKNKIKIVFFVFFVSSALFSESFSFSAENLYSVIAEGKERTVLSGNAKIIMDDVVITSNKIEIYGTDYRYASCTGTVKAVDSKKKINITCEKLFYDRDEEIMRAEEFVEMVDLKNEIVIRGEYIENFNKKDISIIQINTRILKKDMSCRAEFAKYNRELELLELSGFPSVYWKGDEYKASKIFVDLDKDEITLEGDVKARIENEENVSEEDDSEVSEDENLEEKSKDEETVEEN